MNLNELIEYTAVGRKHIEEVMEAKHTYHPDDASIFEGLKRSVARDVSEIMQRVTLQELLTASGTSAVAGAAYLVPVKLHNMLVYASRDYEIAPKVSAMMVNGWEGGSLDAPVVIDESYWGQKTASGAGAASATPAFVKSTITPQLISANIVMDNSFIEDNQYGIIDWCVNQAGSAIAWKENRIFLETITTAPDGDGTLNSSATGDADETRFTSGTTSDVLTAIRRLGDDRFVPNTMIITSEAWSHSVGAHQAPAGWNTLPVAPFEAKLGILDVMFNNSRTLHASTDLDGAAFTNCITAVFDRRNAILTGRKRWLQIENYADPRKDISGAVVTARTDCVSLFKDSIYVLTET